MNYFEDAESWSVAEAFIVTLFNLKIANDNDVNALFIIKILYKN